MFCGNCGSKIPDEVEFCPKCGASVKLNDNVPTETLPVSEPINTFYNEGISYGATTPEIKPSSKIGAGKGICIIGAIVGAIIFLAGFIPWIGNMIAPTSYMYGNPYGMTQATLMITGFIISAVFGGIATEGKCCIACCSRRYY